MILMTAAAMTAMSCNDGRNSAQEDADDNMENNTELAEPDTTTMESDTTSTKDMNDRDDNNMQRGASEESDTESRNQRDTLQ